MVLCRARGFSEWMRHPHRRRRALVAAITVPLLIAAGLTVATTASAAPVDPSGKSTSSRAEAREALADAQAVLAGHGPVTGGPAAREATMTLLRLVRLRASLSGADRAAADRLLARPSDERPGEGWQASCTAANCYHWATSSSDAVSPADSNANGIPDYVESVMTSVDSVRSTYVGAGYRTPKPDGTEGGNAQTDIYLADVGDQGLYGYCTSDEPIPNPPPAWDAWAYCVLDNDYSASQFPTNTPLENLQVTAAHEYFHAVQFAYDAFEDAWFMEATATWAEDELYTDVNDNLQYLANSPLTYPGQPLDTFISGGGPQYGEWIFFRFITEGLTDEQGGLPTAVRDMWIRADGAAGGPDDYSIQAVANVLNARGVSLPYAYSVFAAYNRMPGRYYQEGAANHYPVAAPAGTIKLTKAKKDSRWLYGIVDHLASLTARFVPGKGLKTASWKLKLSLNLPPKSTDTRAMITVVKRSGNPAILVAPLNSQGDGTKKVPFGSSNVKYVEVTLVNAGTRYSCWTGGDYSCFGDSLDNGRKLQVRGVATK